MAGRPLARSQETPASALARRKPPCPVLPALVTGTAAAALTVAAIGLFTARAVSVPGELGSPEISPAASASGEPVGTMPSPGATQGPPGMRTPWRQGTHPGTGHVLLASWLQLLVLSRSTA